MSRSLRTLLDEHSVALASCRRCGHEGDVRPIVSAARTPRVILVGQAPGKVETTGGRPFAGRAGATLFRWFGTIGLEEATAREQIYIAAVTRCYPGPSPTGRGDRVPSLRERACCATWLEDELRIIRPRVVIPVGRLAIDRFLGPQPLDRLVGRAISVEHEGGHSVTIPLPHPSGASSWVHAPAHRAQLAAALQHLARELRALKIIPSSARGRSVA